MKIVIAPDSFKENLTSLEVASEIEAGLRRVWPDAEYVKVPMADGGEGTVQSLVDATGGRIVKCAVTGPLGQKVLASYGLLGDGRPGVIEMAEASGLPLGARGGEVDRARGLFADYGYRIDRQGAFDAEMQVVVRAFQLHFRQSLTDGRLDRSTLDTLSRLAAPNCLEEDGIA